jgi:ketosteroid isomerase-like protein
MSEAGDANLAQLEKAMTPFSSGNIAEVFRDERRVEEIKAALAEIAAPELETVMVGSDSGFSGTFEGPDGFVEGWRDFLDAFETFHNDITEFIEADPDTILVPSRQHAVTATGGVEMDNEAGAVFRFESGRLRQIEFHLDRDEAARSAGIEPG